MASTTLTPEQVFYWTIDNNYPLVTIQIMRSCKEIVPEIIKKGLTSCKTYETMSTIMDYIKDFSLYNRDDAIINSCVMQGDSRMFNYVFQQGFKPSKDTFTLCCLQNKLMYLKMLCEKYKNITLNEHCMLLACKHGFIDICKYLDENNLVKYNTNSLNVCILNNHLEIIKEHHINGNIQVNSDIIKLVDKCNNQQVLRFYVELTDPSKNKGKNVVP